MILTAKNISVDFSGLRALDNVGVQVVPGQVHALIGPNGAGKTTMLNVLSGYVEPSEGSILLDGVDITTEPSFTRAQRGIVRSFQTPRFIPHMSIKDNLLLGFFPAAGTGFVRTILGFNARAKEESALNEQVDILLERFEMQALADEKAQDVPLWRLRVLEIARCLASNPKFVFLDEPAAGSDDYERSMLAQHINNLTTAGVGVLLVEHNFGFIKQLADVVTVFSQGRLLVSGSHAEVENHADVIETYLGGEE